jgi:hypothetical protein
MRNRCPGATAQPAETSEDATPSSSETRTQLVNPDRPLAVIPCSRRADRSASPRRAYTPAAVRSATATAGSAHRSVTSSCSW